MRPVNRGVVMVVVGLAALCACSPREGLTTSGTVAALEGACTPVCDDNFTVRSGDDERSLVLQVPPAYHEDVERPWPLILVLHGFGGDSGSHCAPSSGFYCKAEEEGYIMAYLNGTECDPAHGDSGCDAAHPGRGWNSGLTGSLGIFVDDVQFVRDVIDQVSAEVRIDPRRVYVVGFSNGAIMSHRLAAELPDLLAGVALSAGMVGRDPERDGVYVTIPEGRGSIPILMMHGTEDTAIGIDGTTGYLCPCTSFDQALAYWLVQNPCRGPARAVTEGDVTTTTFAGCYANNDVVQITIDGWPHIWPSIGTEAALDFFAKHSLTAN